MAKVRARRRPEAPSIALNPSVASTMAEIDQVHGSGIITSASRTPSFRHIPTGIFTLDVATLGGIPQSLITMLYGWEHSGKSTLSLRAIAGAQRKYPEKQAVLIDPEGTYQTSWGAIHGIDNDKLLYVSPHSGEQALDIADAMVKTPGVSMLVIDSLAVLVPMKEKERSLEDNGMGEQSRLIGTFARKVQSSLLEQRMYGNYPAIIFVNQWRYKIGVSFGDPRILPGGVSPNYVSSLKIECKNSEKTADFHVKPGVNKKDADTLVAYNTHTIDIKKNKIGTSIRHGEFKMIREPNHHLGIGFIDDAATVATWMKKRNMITQERPPYTIDTPHTQDLKFKSLGAIEDFMYEDPDRYSALKHMLISQHRSDMGLPGGGWDAL